MKIGFRIPWKVWKEHPTVTVFKTAQRAHRSFHPATCFSSRNCRVTRISSAYPKPKSSRNRRKKQSVNWKTLEGNKCNITIGNIWNICIYIYIICIYIYVYIHISTYIYIHIHIRVYMYIILYVYYIYICVCVSVCTFINGYERIFHSIFWQYWKISLQVVHLYRTSSFSGLAGPSFLMSKMHKQPSSPVLKRYSLRCQMLHGWDCSFRSSHGHESFHPKKNGCNIAANAMDRIDDI